MQRTIAVLLAAATLVLCAWQPSASGRAATTSLPALSAADALATRGFACERCKFVGTCNTKLNKLCVFPISEICNECSVNVNEKQCGFSWNPWHSCTVDPDADCGTELLGGCDEPGGACMLIDSAGPCPSVDRCH